VIMHQIKARNAHQMLPVALDYMLKHGKGAESRNGPVLSLEEPCVLEYTRPMERVMFHEGRNANPFFHFMECLWMMAGRNDVALPSIYVRSMANFSDDGLVFNGAYGHRWRVHFGRDQISEVVDMLRRDRNDRRVVLQMWDARHDLGLKSKDLPCNVLILPRIVNDALDITVVNRSNDLVWGALGANAVHMSFLQEWMATAIGVDVGRYFQFSTNMHLYVKTHIDLAETLASTEPALCPYEVEGLIPFPVMMKTNPAEWMSELAMVLDEGTKVIGLKEPFFRRVVIPLMDAWDHYKNDDLSMALAMAFEIQDPAWAKACREWLERKRYAKARAARQKDDGVFYEA